LEPYQTKVLEFDFKKVDDFKAARVTLFFKKFTGNGPTEEQLKFNFVKKAVLTFNKKRV
jgi:hypothetical protein